MVAPTWVEPVSVQQPESATEEEEEGEQEDEEELLVAQVVRWVALRAVLVVPAVLMALLALAALAGLTVLVVLTVRKVMVMVLTARMPMMELVPSVKLLMAKPTTVIVALHLEAQRARKPAWEQMVTAGMVMSFRAVEPMVTRPADDVLTLADDPNVFCRELADASTTVF